MANNFCTYCGCQLSPNDNVCPNCKNAVASHVTYSQPQYYQQPVNPQYYQQANQPVYVVKQKTPGKGFGITSMIMGIIAVFYAFYSMILCFAFSAVNTIIDNPSMGFPSEAPPKFIFEYMTNALSITIFVYVLIFAVLALVFGLCAKKRGYNAGITKSGLIMGIISLGVGVITLVISIASAM